MSLIEPSSSQLHARPAAERPARKIDHKTKVAEDSPAMELADMRELQAISTKLIQEDASGLHDAILDSALRLLRSDMATMQLYDATRDGLTLLSSRGFDPSVIRLFDWVDRDAGTSCALALRSGSRAVIADIETCDQVVGTPAHAALRLCEIRGALSTPLVSRTGAVIGMITNHWKAPHQPSERALLLIDVLARQAADLIDRSRNEERVVLLAREAEHRSKNMLAAVQAVVRLTRAETADEFKKAIVGRINALNNVHRLFVESNWSGADLRTLVAEELFPYCKPKDLKAELSGPDLVLEPTAAQAISMTLHELATNAAKYGALSVAGGHVRVTWSRNDKEMTFHWDERGGPLVKAPEKLGVGTKVMDSMVRGQLNGTIRFDWRDEGLLCEFSLPV
jgi:two-component sensor histidine kinase